MIWLNTGEKMIERVKKYIRENQMLKAGDIVAAGVSGGADSIAMLHILKSIQEEFGFFLEAVHVHHGIRGDEADRDENLVKKICQEWKIPFQSYHYPVPELSSSNFMQRSFGERVAMNAPIQGTAADIIKLAMINVYNALKEHNLRSRLILQVHDELLVETAEDEVETVKQIMLDGMKNAVSLKVPLEVDLKEGKDWLEAH